MLNEETLKILKRSPQVLEIIKGTENLEVLVKILSYKELKNLKLQYPDFFDLDINLKVDIDNLTLDEQNTSTIICLTLVKNDTASKKYDKIKKIKIYIDKLKGEITKILQN